jgi:hypothetical protein
MHIEINDLVDIPYLVSLNLLKRVAQPVVTGKLLAAIDGAVVVKQNRDNSMIKHDTLVFSTLVLTREVRIWTVLPPTV